ncbi:MAG: hypothetical protein GX146_10600, partial [Myxococcales bacterium]|nr:hypothetical protein [Myxococcales bacterium]
MRNAMQWWLVLVLMAFWGLGGCGDSTAESPADTGDEPADTGDEPADTSDEPADTGDELVDTGDEPADTGDEPADTGDEPVDTGDEPIDTGDEPADTGDEPVDTGDEPVDTGDEPIDTGDEPADTSDEPADTGDEPIDTGDEPEPCEDGTFDHDGDPTTPCVPWTVCDPGTYVSTFGTATTDAICESCVPGTFCEGGDAPEIDCADLAGYDDDGDPTTPCVPLTMCGDDQYVSREADNMRDRICAPCPGASTSLGPNAAFCSPQPPRFTAIAAGKEHTCGLDEDGKAHCWG